MTQMTHEEVSTLLRPYAQGTLDDVSITAVDQHLASCRACTAELQVVRLLTTADVQPMDDLERATLHRDVRSAVRVPSTSRREWWGRKLAPAMGAAAVLALIAVGIVSLERANVAPQAVQEGGETSEDTEGGETQNDYDADSAPRAKAEPADAADAATTSDAAGTAGGSTGGGGAARNSGVAAGTAESIEASKPSVLRRDRAGITVVDRSFASASFDPGSLVAARPRAGKQGLLGRGALFTTPGSGGLEDIVRRCVDVTLATSPYPLMPTSATFYRRDDILVVTFVWVDESDTLNYELRGWRSGACERPSPIYRRGRVR